ENVKAQRRARPPRAAPTCDVKRRTLATKASLLFFFCLLGLLVAVATAELTGRQGAGRTSLQVYVEVVDEAHHVLVVAERGHHKFGTGFVALLAGGHDPEEVAVRN